MLDLNRWECLLNLPENGPAVSPARSLTCRKTTIAAPRLSNNIKTSLAIAMLAKKGICMSEAIVVRGHYVGQAFIPDEPLPLVEGPAELIVFPRAKTEPADQPLSIFDLFGKAPHLRSAEDIEAQVREVWGEG